MLHSTLKIGRAMFSDPSPGKAAIPRKMKLAVFVDQVFWSDGQRYSTDTAFVGFVTGFKPYVDKIVFCGRVDPKRKTERYVFDPAYVEMCEFPYYDDVYSLWRKGPAVIPKIISTFWKGLDDWDLVWLCVPHPFSALFALMCLLKRKRFFMMVRQNLLEQVRHRSRGLMKPVAMGIVQLLETFFQTLARNHVTFTIGHEMYEVYNPQRNKPVYESFCSLVRRADIERARDSHSGSAKGVRGLRLLYVGRLDPEKGIEHLLEAMTILRAIPEARDGIELKIVGTGQRTQALKQRTAALGLGDIVQFAGYVTHGEDLYKLFREATAFVLPSLTGEGLPQVLLEAMACNTPSVATRVAGIPYLIKHETNGLLVDPANPQQLADAVARLHRDPDLTTRITAQAARDILEHTMEAEIDTMLHALRQQRVWPSTTEALS